MIKKILPLLVSFLLLGGLILFSDINKIYQTLFRINIYFFLCAIGLWFLSHLIKIVRWNYLLGENGVFLKFLDSLKIFTASMFISNITPSKLGEPVRSLILKKNQGVNVSKSLPSIFFERVFDIASLIFISVIAMFFLSRSPLTLRYWFLISIIFYAFFIGIGFFVFTSKKRFFYVLSKTYKLFSFFPRVKELNNRLEDFATNFHQSFLSYKNKRLYGIGFMLSCCIWIIEGLILYIIFISFNLDVTLASTLFIVPVSTLIAVISLLPGGIGSSEIITVLFFASLFGLTFTDVTTVTLVARVATFWSSTILGAIFLSKLDYRLSSK